MDAKLSVKQTIEKYGLIEKGDKVLLGFSGGPDSLCLLSILAELRGSLGFELYALHLNHCIRGEQADEDEAFALKAGAEHGVQVFAVRRDVPALAKQLGTSAEEAGRIARMQALSERAAALGGAKIALAHNRNDQAETVLMRLLRGTGVHGLAAMEYKRQDGLIRPLLGTPRELIERYCEDNGLCARIDASNKQEIYTRNKLRLSLIPQIEKEYNPNFRDGLVRLSENAREDDECLSELAKDSFVAALKALPRSFLKGQPQQCCEASEARDVIVLDTKKLRELQPALLKRVICLGFAEIGLTQDIAAVHLNSLCSAIYEKRGGKTIEFHAGYTARTSAKETVLSKN